jgi:mannosyltransferase
MSCARPVVPLVAGLTAVGLIVRLVTAEQSLFGDELFTYDVVTRVSPGEAFARFRRIEANPPLYHVLAWVVARLGDPPLLTRLPSVLLGSASVPLVYVIGTRTVGRRPALVGAALLALSPFAVFYSSEARAYMTMMFFVVVSVLLLLLALERSSVRWWVGLGIASVAALYTHYTAVFAIAALPAWAVVTVPRARRPVLLTYGAVVLAYVPWLPFLNSSPLLVEAIGALYSFSAAHVAESTLRALVGLPFGPLERFPGPLGFLALSLLGVALIAGAATSIRRPRAPSAGSRQRATLLIAVALATPVALLVYSALETNLYVPRNLTASVPAALLLIGAALTRLPPAAMWSAASVLLTVFVVGCIELLGPMKRPATKDAAAFVEANAFPEDVIGEASVFGSRGPLARPSRVYLNRPLRPLVPRGGVFEAARRRGARVFVIGPTSHPAKPPGDFGRVYERTWNGLYPVSVRVYGPRR